MKKKIFSMIALVVVFVFLANNFVWAYSDDTRIVDIQIKGNSSVSSSTILSRLKLRPGDRYEESALNKELKRLYATGYFGDVFVETEERPDGVIVIFTVIEKPVIERIAFRGNVRIKTKALQKKLFVKEGVLLDFHLLSEDVASLTNFYIEKGYSRVSVDYSIETDPSTGQATVVFTIDEGNPLRIKAIDVEGNKQVSDAEIKKYMATKPSFWFLTRGVFDEDKFQADLDRIRSFLRSKGFLDAQVTSRFEYSPDGKFMYITIIVDEGRKYLIGEIDVEGDIKFSELEIRDLIKVRSGYPFDYQKIKQDIDRIQEFYFDRGYMDAEVDVKHKYDPASDRMNLVFIANANNEVFVGKVNIKGNIKTKNKVIRRELRVYPGAKYDGAKLKKSKERIYNLGYFEDVYFDTVSTDDPEVKDLNVTVKETKTGELSFGGGYSSVDSFIGFVQIRQRNFDILKWPTFTGAGQDLIIRGEMGSARTNYLISWTDPWIFDMPYLFGFDLYRTEDNKYGGTGYDYDETRTGGSLRIGKDLTDDINTMLIYNLEEVKIGGVDSGDAYLKSEEGTNKISRLTWSIKWDTRDNVYAPRNGWVTGLSLENAGGFIGGDKNFFKTYTYGSYYKTFFEKIVLELGSRGGIVTSYGNSDSVPIYERFFAGGATTIRGYEQRAVGPRDAANNPIGGESLFIGNVEVGFPVFKNVIRGAVFFDFGNVWENTGDFFKGGVKSGAGIGIRVKTPIGPVRLDWGYPLNENHGDKKEGRFYFSVSHGW